MFMILNNYIRRGLALAVIACALTLLWCDSGLAATFGSISVKAGVPVTPDPAPNALPNNIRFFKNNSKPSPIAAGLSAPDVDASGSAADALYSINVTGTITVLVEKTAEYGRTNRAENMTTTKPAVMDFPGGAPKAYQLIDNISPWYLKEPPPAGTVAVQLLGYTPDLEPMLKFALSGVSTTNHEIASFATDNGTGSYLFRVRQKDTSTWKYYSTSGTTFQPVPANALGSGQPFALNTVYEVQAAAKNWFVAADESNLNWSPLAEQNTGSLPGGGPFDVTFSLKAGINTFSLPFIMNDSTNKPVTIGGQNLDANDDGSVSVKELLSAIATEIYASATSRVTVFAFYDESEQRHKGLAPVDLRPARDGKMSVSFGTRPTPGDNSSDILGATVVPNRPYQISVSADSTFTLNGYAYGQ
ncbi:hypothetical protein ACFL37_00025 [Candidatus Margulisiibacteriota bacterium]